MKKSSGYGNDFGRKCEILTGKLKSREKMALRIFWNRINIERNEK